MQRPVHPAPEGHRPDALPGPEGRGHEAAARDRTLEPELLPRPSPGLPGVVDLGCRVRNSSQYDEARRHEPDCRRETLARSSASLSY